jgi:hypothetical protein
MTLTEIERALSELRLSGIAATLNTRVMQAQSSQEPFWTPLPPCCRTNWIGAVRV